MRTLRGESAPAEPDRRAALALVLSRYRLVFCAMACRCLHRPLLPPRAVSTNPSVPSCGKRGLAAMTSGRHFLPSLPSEPGALLDCTAVAETYGMGSRAGRADLGQDDLGH